MATKQITMNEALNGHGCLGKSHPDEPVFVLCGRDLHAPYTVRQWAEAAAVILGWDHPKVTEAMDCARAMEAWPDRKLPD